MRIKNNDNLHILFWASTIACIVFACLPLWDIFESFDVVFKVFIILGLTFSGISFIIITSEMEKMENNKK